MRHTDPLSLEVFVQARQSTKPTVTVKEKGLINLCTRVLYMYQLLQTTSFEMHYNYSWYFPLTMPLGREEKKNVKMYTCIGTPVNRLYKFV